MLFTCGEIIPSLKVDLIKRIKDLKEKKEEVPEKKEEEIFTAEKLKEI